MTVGALRIVFVGLIAFSQVDDTDLMLFARAKAAHHPHVSLIVQLEGTCAGEMCHWPDGETFPPACADRLCWKPNGLDLALEFETPEETQLIAGSNDVPSVARVVPGTAPLRPSCKTGLANCNVSARFSLPEDRVSTCHSMHLPSDCDSLNAGKVLTYKVGDNHRQTIGNALLFEQNFSGSVRLTGQTGEGETIFVELSRSVDGKITLVAANEPVVSRDKAQAGRCTPPQQLTHFSSFFSLVAVPHAPGEPHGPLLPKHPGFLEAPEEEWACEGEIESYEAFIGSVNEWLGGRYEIRSFPHGASECDTATIP